MARRDLSNFTTVTQVVADIGSEQLAGAVAQTASDYLQTSMKAKVSSSYMDMQVDLNQLSKQIELDYQDDPAMGKQKYMEGFEKLKQQYGGGISPLYGGEWNESINKLKANQTIQMDNWVGKQSQANAIAYTENSIEKAYLLAEETGRNFGRNGGEIDAALNYDSQFEGLKESMVKAHGAIEGEEKFEEFEKGWVKSSLVGIAEVDPSRARQILDSNLAERGFSFEERAQLSGLIGKAESMRKKRLKYAETGAWTQGQRQINETYLSAINGELSLFDYYNDESLSEADKLVIDALAFGDEEAQETLIKDARQKGGKSFEEIDIFTLKDQMNSLVSSFDPEDRDATFTQATVLKNLASAARAHNSKNRGQGITKREYEDFLSVHSEAMTKVKDTAGGFEGDTWFFDTGRDLVYNYLKEQPISDARKRDYLAYGLNIAKAKGLDLSSADTDIRENNFNIIKNELIKRRKSDLGAPNDKGVTAAIKGSKKEVFSEKQELGNRAVRTPSPAIIKFEDL